MFVHLYWVTHAFYLAFLGAFLGAASRFTCCILSKTPITRQTAEAGSFDNSLYIKAKHQPLGNLDVLLVRLHKLAGLAMHMTVLCRWVPQASTAVWETKLLNCRQCTTCKTPRTPSTVGFGPNRPCVTSSTCLVAFNCRSQSKQA